MSNTGVITAGTALKALAYKDSLTKSDVGLGNVKNQAITVTTTSVSDGTNTFSKYTHPSHTAHSAGLYKVTIDALGHVTAATAVAKADITGLGIPGSDTDTKNTAGSTDTSSKIFLIGATSQATNPQTYSDNEVYVSDGNLTAKTVSGTAGINANSASSGTAGGLSLYAYDPVSYGVTMRKTGTGTGELGKHGFVQGD